MSQSIPLSLNPTMRRAERLEWWSIGWTISVIAVMSLLGAVILLAIVNLARRGTVR